MDSYTVSSFPGQHLDDDSFREVFFSGPSDNGQRKFVAVEKNKRSFVAPSGAPTSPAADTKGDQENGAREFMATVEYSSGGSILNIYVPRLEAHGKDAFETEKEGAREKYFRRCRATKLAAHKLLCEEYMKLTQKKPTIKRRNSIFRDLCREGLEAHGLGEGYARVKAAINAIYWARNTLNTVEEKAAEVLATMKRLTPHLVAMFARWIFQPPTLMAIACDIFILVERIAPEMVRESLLDFVNRARRFTTEMTERVKSSSTAHSYSRASADVNEAFIRPVLECHGKDEDDIASFSLCLGELLTGVKMGAKTSLKLALSWGKIVKDLHQGGRSALAIARPVMEFLSKYAKIAIAYVRTGDVRIDDVHPVDFVMDVEHLLAMTDDEKKGADFPQAVNAVWRQAVNVRRRLTLDETIPRHVREQLNHACNQLAKFRENHYVQLQSTWSPVRKTPYCIAFVGGSGSGKSDVSAMFIRDLLHPSNCPIEDVASDYGSLIFHDRANKHKDGYRGQPAWYRDDLGQKPEGENTTYAESDWNFLINAVSGTQLPLEMAQLQNKNMYFNSVLFVYTANRVYPTPKSVDSHHAVQRRRNLLVYVTYKENSNLYPEEAVEYEDDEGKFRETRLHDTQFHILPSCRMDANGNILGDGSFVPPKHGDPTGMSYTELLAYTVPRFNSWMETSQSRRLLAKIPASRLHFGRGAKPARLAQRPNRLCGEGETPINPLTGAPMGRNLYAHGSEGFEDVLGSNISSNWATMAFLKQCAESAKFGFDAFIALFKERPMLVLAEVISSIALGFITAWALFAPIKVNVLIPPESIEEFVKQCSPLIRDELKIMLQTASLDLERAKLEANVAAGYGERKLDPKAARVAAPAHLQRLEANIAAGYGERKLDTKAARVSAPRHLQGAVSKLTAQGLQNNLDLEDLIFRNLMTIKIADNSFELQMLGVKGRWGVLNAHFFDFAEKTGKFVNGHLPVALETNNTTRWCGEIPKKDFIVLGGDVAIVRLPPQCPQFRDISKHIISASDYHKTTSVDVRVVTCKGGVRRSARTFAKLSTQEISYENSRLGATYTVADHYDAHLTTVSKGDCGAPVIVEHLNKICAIHAAGDGFGRVVFVPISREIFDDLPIDFKLEEPTITLQPLEAHVGEAVPEGIVPPAWSNFVMDKTDIEPSVVHAKVVPVQKAPSVKSLRDPRISEEARNGLPPLYKSFAQLFDPVRDVPSVIWAKAVQAVAIVLSSIRPTPILGKRILTEDEVLNGVPGEYVSLNIHTSAGMPQRNYSAKPGKTGFFDRDPDTGKLSWGTSEAAKKFKADYEHYDKLLQDRTIPFVVLLEQLKDETLKLSKIESAKTRTFEVFPGPLALLCRKYFGAFNAAAQAQCVEEPISVGINPHSKQWQMLYNRLNKFGGKVIAGDYQAWDKRLTAQAMMEGAKRINEWYSDEYGHVREALVYLMIHSYVVVGKVLFQVHQGMPSGVPITSTLNSVCNLLYLYSAMFACLEQAGVLDEFLPKDVVEESEIAVYGDDHIVALSARLREFISFAKVRKHFLDRGVGYTDASKSARADFDFEDLRDVTYLKRSFKVDGASVFAPLDRASVEDQLNWVKRSKELSPLESLLLCYDSFTTEACLHGKEYFEPVVEKLTMELSRLPKETGVRIPRVSYEDVMAKYLLSYSQ